MSARRLLTFADALVLLGADPPRLAALDRALGGALNIATGGVSGTVVGMADARGRILGLGRDAVRGLGERLVRAQGRAARTELLRAAHSVIVVVAFLEAMRELPLPFALDDVELTRGEQLALARDGLASPSPSPGAEAGGLVQLLLDANVPYPTPEALDRFAALELRLYYTRHAVRFQEHCEGLAFWENLDPRERSSAESALHDALPDAALAAYQRLYEQLVVQAPEFAFWTTQLEHRATRAVVHRSLEGVSTLLARTAEAFRPPVDVAAALSTAHEAALARPVLDARSAPDGISIPTIGELYLDPDFRVRAVSGQTGPADEAWWERVPVRHDLTRFLAGVLTSPQLTETPLLILGQPGAGKSVLTRVLAARLPAAGFLPVRVPLRDIRAEDELQDQIEQAIRAATGETVKWPQLVREANGSMPVLLLDGFDELLQTTGVHQNNFLVRVARFQQREAEQGRPVMALVTSRTAVADRARYPDGMVALRLEPFRDEQVRQWLTVWNAANEAYAASRGRTPLRWEHVARQREFAVQPLLLTMLALYDAAGGSLQDAFDVADLYEQLLTSFARREVTRTTPDSAPEEVIAHRVEQELQRLSLVAFAQLNRGRQWVSAAELEEDLTAVLGRQQTAQPSGFHTPLTAAEQALGRFFFMQRAQSVRDGQVLATYEFLHATFGEYLAVRLTLHLLTDLLAPRSALSIGDARIDDDLAYALLSYTSLASRQMPRFARALTARMPTAERHRLGDRLIQVFHQHGTRTGDQHPTYRPSVLRTTTRHGLYGSNLVLMIVLLTDGCSAAELFPESGDPVSAWHRHCLLWRSAMDESRWTDFASSLDVHRHWDDTGRRALRLSPRTDPGAAPEPLDMNWLYRYPRGHDGHSWSRSYWDSVWHKMDLSSGTNDQVVRHAVDPVFRWLGAAVTTFTPMAEAPASSLAHDVLELLLADRAELTDSRLDDLHERVVRGAHLLLEANSPYFPRVMSVLLRAFAEDRERLSAAVTALWRSFVDQLVALLVRGAAETPLPLQLWEDSCRVVRASRHALRELLPEYFIEDVDRRLHDALRDAEGAP